MGFTEVLIPKFHSRLTPELHLFTQMQICPAGGAVICKGIYREESSPPHCVSWMSKANSKSLDAVPAGQAWGWAVMEGVLPLSGFTQLLTLCHNRFGLPWIKFLTQAVCLSWTSKNPGKHIVWLRGAGMQNQVIWEHLCNSSWCHCSGWRYQTHLVSFFLF